MGKTLQIRPASISLYLLCLIALLPGAFNAQTLYGKVTNEYSERLTGVSIHWEGTNTGATTNTYGEFEISMTGITAKKLIAGFVGYETDTIDVGDQKLVTIVLTETQALNEVVVRGQRDGVIISDIDPIKTEQITQTELGKAACCDLAGCFETQTTVQPQTTNVITNSKELRILGLSGVYNQVLVDGFPVIQGLTYTYGISTIPGTLVDNIYVAKGANSVLQGYESISGQINVETKEPDATDKLYLYGYINRFQEKHLNGNYAFRKGKWSNLTAVHTVHPAKIFDQDDDDFLDVTKLRRYMIFNKWKYGNDRVLGWSSRIGLRFLHEQRVGGQTSYDADRDKGSTTVYGQSVRLNQPEAWTKTTYRFNERNALVAFVNAGYQDQASWFGTASYDAKQISLYANLQYELNYAGHTIKTGISHRLLNLEENISFSDNFLVRTYAGKYKREDNIPGVFAENTLYLLGDKLTWIAGIRADHHNIYGTKVTPRTLLKYNLASGSVVRASIGKGWRVVNLFSENIGLLASSRDIIFEESLEPEEAINYGVNYTQKFNAENGNFSGYFSADYYRTDFRNQVFPDYDADPTKAIIRNFRGESVSNGFQAELYLKLWERFELKTGYNFLDVYRMVGEEKELLPFNARHKVLGTFSYKPMSNRFHFDMNLHWYGEQRLPDTKSNPAELQRPDFSKPYSVLSAQFTYTFSILEVYAGSENIFDFRQERPILSWENPFGPYFDTSSVWGPTRGREMYIGVRYRLKGNE